MLLATSRTCTRPVTFLNSFDKYNYGRERPEGDIGFSNVLQSPTGSLENSSHFLNVRLRDFGQWTTELSSMVYVEFRGDRRF